MSLQCEGTPSWERGKKKIRQKSAISAVALSLRRRAAFWGNAANVLFAPSPSRVFPRAPFPLNSLPLSPFFLWLRGICPTAGSVRSCWLGALCRFALLQGRGLNPWLWAVYAQVNTSRRIFLIILLLTDLRGDNHDCGLTSSAFGVLDKWGGLCFNYRQRAKL